MCDFGFVLILMKTLWTRKKPCYTQSNYVITVKIWNVMPIHLVKRCLQKRFAKKVLFEKKYFLMSKSLDTRGNCLTQVLGNWFSQLNNCHYTANIRGCRFQLCIFPKSFRMNMNLKLENISKSFYFCLGTKFSIRTGKAEHGVHRVHMHPHILPGKAA